MEISNACIYIHTYVYVLSKKRKISCCINIKTASESLFMMFLRGNWLVSSLKNKKNNF